MAFLDEIGLAELWGLISNKHNGLVSEYVWAKYENSQVPKIAESATVEKVAMYYRVGVSTFTVQYADSVKMSGDSVVLVNPTTISGSTSNYSSYASQTVGKYVVSAENGKVYKIAGAATEWYGDYIGQTGYLVSVEHVMEYALVGYVNSPDPNAYPVGDGYTYKALGQLGNKAQIATGSYVGTGTYGVSNPNKLTFDFEPKLFVLYGMGNGTNATAAAPLGSGYIIARNGTQTVFTANLEWNGNEISWYSPSNGAAHQANTLGETYYYCAIG